MRRCERRDVRRPLPGTLHPRTHDALVEPGRADVERGVEARAQVLDSDRLTQLDELAPRRSARAAPRTARRSTCDGRDGHRRRRVEHEPLELVEVRALAVAMQGEQLRLADARRARLAEPMSWHNSQPCIDRRLQRHERSQARRHARACDATASLEQRRSRSAARGRGRVPECRRRAARAGRSSVPLRAVTSAVDRCERAGLPRSGGTPSMRLIVDAPSRRSGRRRSAASAARSSQPSSSGGGGQREEVEVAVPARVGVADVDEVVDRVQRELHGRHGEHRHAPGGADDRHREAHAERGAERRDVADVVGVVRVERADALVEGVGAGRP